MINLDDAIVQDYLTECREQLVSVEEDLQAIERCGAEVDVELVDRVFRALHWVQGGARLFDLTKIRDLAHQSEGVLALIRSHKLVPNPERIRVLLDATDRLQDLVQDPGASNQADIVRIMAALMMLDTNRRKQRHSELDGMQQVAKRLRVLLVEDDFCSRLVLQTFLSRYGECHIAVNGWEAVEAFRSALEHGQRYDLICMDIMMPKMDGREAVRQIRALEVEHGILSTWGAKIIMTTAVNGVKEVGQCFHELCDSYLTKPIDLAELLGQMKAYQLVQ
jgi:two-component system, chemotaxis family, chemotaxis protein CheY